MKAPIPEWKACVETFGLEASAFDNLRNAVLYADRITWVSLETLVYALLKIPGRGDGWLIDATNDRQLRWEAVDDVYHQLTVAGLDRSVVDHFWLKLEENDTVTNLVRRMPTDPTGSLKELSVLAAEGCRTVVSARRSEPPKNWNSYSVASVLMNSLSGLLLPDVSSLPFEAIAEMREYLGPYLDPMRSEMLRFTESLRKIVDNISDPRAIKAEADNLIATCVEPVVREASARSDRLAAKKWRKLYAGSAKAFGLIGASYFDPKLLARAVQQSLEVSALAFGKTEDEKSDQPRATAEFVLHAATVARGLKA